MLRKRENISMLHHRHIQKGPISGYRWTFLVRNLGQELLEAIKIVWKDRNISETGEKLHKGATDHICIEKIVRFTENSTRKILVGSQRKHRRKVKRFPSNRNSNADLGRWFSLYARWLSSLSAPFSLFHMRSDASIVTHDNSKKLTNSSDFYWDATQYKWH